MMPIAVVAGQEIRAGLRNRWVLATTGLLAALALSLALLGTAPVGAVDADPLAVVVVSLASLSIFLLPLIAMLLSFDAIVGEQERGTLLLLLAYPLARWQVLVGKFLGHSAILAAATVLGYGAVAAVLAMRGGIGADAWAAFAAMVATSILLGAVFVALGCLASVAVRERATAAGLAVGIWLFFVLLYDMLLLGMLVADQGQAVSAAMLDVLLLFNPTDAYRLFNLSGSEATRLYSGMVGPGEAGRISTAALVAALASWVVLPLAAAIVVFQRREP